MTTPEHCMLGAVLSHLGFHQRWGRPVTAFMVAVAWLPDLDSVALLLGARAFSTFHRGVTHSAGGVVLISALAAAVGPLVLRLGRAVRDAAGPDSRRGRMMRFLGFDGRSEQVLRNVPVLFTASMLVLAFHLGADALSRWPIPLLWPLTGRRLALPVLQWGDLTTVLVLVAGVFALALVRRRRRLIALTTLSLLAGYVAGRYLLLGTT